MSPRRILTARGRDWLLIAGTLALWGYIWGNCIYAWGAGWWWR